MAECPVTRPSLMVRIRDLGDAEAWGQFVEIYGPVVYGFARKQGLQEADAADLTQEVLRDIAAAAAGRLEYDPQKGKFRSWLYTVARNKLHDFIRAHSRQCQGSGDTEVQKVLAEQPAAEDNALWDAEYQQKLFAWAGERVRSRFEATTWQAFCQVAVEGKSPKNTAATLGMTLAAVYMAKSRVLAALRAEIRDLLGDDALS